MMIKIWHIFDFYSPGHVENSLSHNKSHSEEKISGRNEGENQEQQSHQHFLVLLPLNKGRTDMFKAPQNRFY